MIYDCIVIGSGIVGLSVAYSYSKKYPNNNLLVIEKESSFSMHQTGNNSGVIHSGIYYKPGSLKAENCQKGYKMMIDFAQNHNIHHEICGKIIVATNNEENVTLEEIYNRGVSNGLKEIKLLSPSEIKDFEPNCVGVRGIRVPQTGIINYKDVAKKIVQLLKKKNIEIVFNNMVRKIINNNIIQLDCNKKSYKTKKLIVCAGLFSDRLLDENKRNNSFRIIPFRGEYYKLKEKSQNLINNLIYPVPDIKFPFLGVHFTRMIGGGVEAGPNAVLAFKREGYKFSDFDFYDTLDIITWPGFWKNVRKYGHVGAYEMYRSLSKKAFTKSLQKLVPLIEQKDLTSGGAGVRAQICMKNGTLLDDFKVHKNKNIINVINAPSPAATSSFSIADNIINKLEETDK